MAQFCSSCRIVNSEFCVIVEEPAGFVEVGDKCDRRRYVAKVRMSFLRNPCNLNQTENVLDDESDML